MFVLSGTHYGEMLKIKDPAQRRDIANVMEELTGFATLVSRVVVMEFELTAMLDRCAKAPSLLPMIPLIGRGVRHAVGLQSGLRIMGPSGDETDGMRENMGAKVFDDFVAQANLDLERSVLRGPTHNNEVKNMAALSWNPEAVMQVAETRADQERALTLRLNGEERWRRGRLRDVVSVCELEIEFQNILPRALAERGLVLRDVISDQESARIRSRDAEYRSLDRIEDRVAQKRG